MSTLYSLCSNTIKEAYYGRETYRMIALGLFETRWIIDSDDKHFRMASFEDEIYESERKECQ